MAKPNWKHGHSGTPEYFAWHAMIGRCTRPELKAYADYGGRGIRVCARWRKSLEAFLEDMGKRPSARHSLDRKDVNGDYTPKNCRWATKREQIWNRRTSCLITAFGHTATAAEWSRITGLRECTIDARVRRQKWDPETALSVHIIREVRIPVLPSPQLGIAAPRRTGRPRGSSSGPMGIRSGARRGTLL